MGSDSAKQLSMCFKSKPCLIPLTPMGFKQRLWTELNSGLKIPLTFFPSWIPVKESGYSACLEKQRGDEL